MYEQYYGFQRKPFDLLPNPDFLFLSETHKKAITYLNYGLTEMAGFILLTGEVGSGKTTVIRGFMRKLGQKVRMASVFNTKVTTEELLCLVNEDFGLPSANRNKAQLIKDLYRHLMDNHSKGIHSVLIIDEAQNLSVDVLEEIRMLSNLETDSSKLLQIVLVGQPELKQQLARTEMRQLRQRIGVNCNLMPLNNDETMAYIYHRLTVAGNGNAVQFEADALDQIYRASRGIPRLINMICDYLLLSAFTEQIKKIDAEMVNDIVEDLDIKQHFNKPKQSSPEREQPAKKGIDYNALLNALGVASGENPAMKRS